MPNHSNFKQSTSICTTIDTNAVHIRKVGIENGIVVFYMDNYTCVISDTVKVGKTPLFLLVKEFDGPTKDSDSYDRWLHVIGKQIKKDNVSKYFTQHESMHFKNGSFNESDTKSIERLKREAHRLIQLI